jgi:hypothetical protein
MNQMDGACSKHGEMRGAYRILVGKTGKIDLEEIGVDGRTILK